MSTDNEPTCAYTGAILSIDKIEGTALWCVKGAFNPAEWVSGTEFATLRKQLMQRPGGKTVRKLKCPYKGTEIVLEEHMGMVRASGAFSPGMCVWHSRQEALWEVSWRNGQPPDFPERIKIVVGDIRYPESDPMQGYGATTNDLNEQVKELME